MTINKWGIYRANLDPIIGSEQGKSRLVVIISEDEINEVLSIVNVLPITSRKAGRQIYPNETLVAAGEFGLPNESIILCHQIRTLDKQRLSSIYGKIDNNEIRNSIIEALCFQLGINKS